MVKHLSEDHKNKFTLTSRDERRDRGFISAFPDIIARAADTVLTMSFSLTSFSARVVKYFKVDSGTRSSDLKCVKQKQNHMNRKTN